MKIDELYTWNDIREFRMQQAGGDVNLLAALEKDGFITWDEPGILLEKKV